MVYKCRDLNNYHDKQSHFKQKNCLKSNFYLFTDFMIKTDNEKRIKFTETHDTF
jgi:hypothetical protein